MLTCVAAIDAVVAVGIELHFKLLVSLHQRFGVFIGVAHMHIVVCQSVANQQIAMKFGDTGYAVVVVT